MQPDTRQAAYPQREQPPFVLESAELAFDGDALSVQRLESFGPARDERVQPVGLDPCGCGPVGFQNSATGLDLGFYAARSYSLRRPLRTGRRLIRSGAGSSRPGCPR